MSLDRPLSNLELTVLGVILKRGSCLAHTVVSQFAESQTLAYRSGAGSIYPLLKRLASAGYLTYKERKYSLAPQGLAALRDWVCPPFGPDAFSANLDSLRSRSYFLKLLTPEQVQQFLDEAIAGLELLLEQCRVTLAEQRASGDRFGEFAMQGAVLETEARIAWLQTGFWLSEDEGRLSKTHQKP